ncbi:hypothetical protein HYZ80_00210 [Candidatus Parcubacteria bacterium]|nr:hypothetical protein [Candidatus Parcubacteria bacterium]
MPTHGTALTEGQTAEFVGAGTKALILIANRLGPNLADKWAHNGEAMQRAFLGALMPPEEKPAPAAIAVLSLLEEIDTITIPATAERFVARDKFVLNYGDRAKPGVRISYLGENFNNWFLGKTEGPTAEATLRYARLTRPELAGPILAELGDRKETTLAAIYVLMERQPNGKSGTLLNNGWANVFYVPDRKGMLRAVFVYWFGNVWYVNAYSVEHPNRWDDGYQVFSRNSLVAVAA